MRGRFGFRHVLAASSLTAAVSLLGCQELPPGPELSAASPVTEVATAASAQTAASAARCSGPAVDLTPPGLKARLEGATLVRVGAPSVEVRQQGTTSTKVSSARFRATGVGTLADDAFDSEIEVTTTCTLTCTGRYCTMNGCDLVDDGCTSFDCGHVGQCAGSCTKTQQ